MNETTFNHCALKRRLLWIVTTQPLVECVSCCLWAVEIGIITAISTVHSVWLSARLQCTSLLYNFISWLFLMLLLMGLRYIVFAVCFTLFLHQNSALLFLLLFLSISSHARGLPQLCWSRIQCEDVKRLLLHSLLFIRATTVHRYIDSYHTDNDKVMKQHWIIRDSFNSQKKKKLIKLVGMDNMPALLLPINFIYFFFLLNSCHRCAVDE